MHPPSFLIIPLFANGYLVRDGVPATGHTQVARCLAAFICGIGGLCYSSNLYFAVGIIATTLLSFYTDMKHAEGQNAETKDDAQFLILSGVTSALPYCIAAVAVGSYITSDLILLIGYCKPLVWFGCRIIVGKDNYFTRYAATIFGALIGAAIFFGGIHG